MDPYSVRLEAESFSDENMDPSKGASLENQDKNRAIRGDFDIIQWVPVQQMSAV